jgi:hypothetical protein
VRGNLPLTLIVSLALHVGTATGIVFAYAHGIFFSAPVSPEVTQPVAMILLHPELTPPALQHPQPALPKPAVTVAENTPLPSPAQPVMAKALPAPAVVQPPMEANPNANVMPLPPEAVLSPSPAPQLNSANGVVFILDISGSMYEPYAGATRLAFARQALCNQIRALKEGTPFAVTLYGERALASGPLVAANNATREAAARFLMRDPDCGGGTNLPAGLACAEQLHPGALVLASDGDLNISAYNLALRASAILGPKKHSPALTIIGIAPRPTTGDERLLEGLAEQQGGTYLAGKIGNDAEMVSSAAGVTKPDSAMP